MLPTRLLNVNVSNNPDDLRLDVGKEANECRFIALYYCWGPSDKMPSWCTTRENVQARHEHMSLSQLPKTFQDAVKITRELGLQYLWIDSLCIVQGKNGDWEQQARKMEQVFNFAYCTIAATAAASSLAGFLSEYTQAEQKGVYVRDASGSLVYISTTLVGFDEEVEEADINNRAWVMQERFLSPRTIHFGLNQIFGECGDSVYIGDKILEKYVSGKPTLAYLPPLTLSFPVAAHKPGSTINLTPSFQADSETQDLVLP
jgi:hypothetical protein